MGSSNHRSSSEGRRQYTVHKKIEEKGIRVQFNEYFVVVLLNLEGVTRILCILLHCIERLF